MCLDIDNNVELVFIDGVAEVYKMVMRTKGTKEWRSPYQLTLMPHHGFYHSERANTLLDSWEEENGEVLTGIHVFLNLDDLQLRVFNHNLNGDGEYFIVKCRAWENDLVAKGFFFRSTSAVFTKIEIIGEIQCA